MFLYLLLKAGDSALIPSGTARECVLNGGAAAAEFEAKSEGGMDPRLKATSNVVVSFLRQRWIDACSLSGSSRIRIDFPAFPLYESLTHKRMYYPFITFSLPGTASHVFVLCLFQ